jgi:hypothetical protein
MKTRDIKVGAVVIVSMRAARVRWIGTVIAVEKSRYGTDVRVTRPQRWIDLGIFSKVGVRAISWDMTEHVNDASLLWPWSDTDVAPEFDAIKRERMTELARLRAERDAIERDMRDDIARRAAIGGAS